MKDEQRAYMAYMLRLWRASDGGTEDLASVHGVLYVLGIPGIQGTYGGVVQFGPDR